VLKGIGREATYYYHPDHLGSVSVVSNHRGEPYERVEYLPFGEIWIEETDPATGYIPFRFTSKELDEETGLYYYGARYYEPTTSRWMSADPAGFELVNPMDKDGELRADYSVIEALNWYAYVSNNPVKYVDPTGESEMLTTVVSLGKPLSVGSSYGIVIQKEYGKVLYPEACMAFSTSNSLTGAGYDPKEGIDNSADFVNERVGQSYEDIIEDTFGVEMEAVKIPSGKNMEEIAELVGDNPALIKFKQSDFWGNKDLKGEHGISYHKGMMIDPYTGTGGSDFDNVRGSKSTADFDDNTGGYVFEPKKEEE